MNGICYSMGFNAVTYSQASAACASNGSQLAIIRSADVGTYMAALYLYKFPEKFVSCVLISVAIFSQANGPTMAATFWIGSPNGNTSVYNSIDGTRSQFNQHSQTLVVNVNSGQCLGATSNITYMDKIFISDNQLCTNTNPYLCETCKKRIRPKIFFLSFAF